MLGEAVRFTGPRRQLQFGGTFDGALLTSGSFTMSSVGGFSEGSGASGLRRAKIAPRMGPCKCAMPYLALNERCVYPSPDCS